MLFAAACCAALLNMLAFATRPSLDSYLGDSELTSLKGSIDSGVGSLFDGLVALQELGLDDNEIRVLEAGAFADLGALQYLCVLFDSTQ